MENQKQLARTGILTILMASALAGQATGVISGTVFDEKGKAFNGGVRITVLKAPERPEGFQPFVTTVAADKDGRYRASGIPVGKYELCLTTFGTEYVDVCEWGRPSATVFVTAAVGTVSKDLVLEKGKVFTIDLKDDDGYVDRHEGKSTGGVLNVGVTTEAKGLVMAELASSTKVNRRYRVVVPVGAKFRVRVIGPLFDVKTENEALQSLRVLQDLDQVIEDKDAGKSVSLKVGGLKDAGAK